MPTRLKSAFRRRRAVILILSLWIAIILSMMAFSVAHEVQINLRLAKQTQDALQATALARAGMAKAVVDLRNDRILAIADQARWNSDTLQDIWAQAKDKSETELGNGTFSVRVVDEERKIGLGFLNVLNARVFAFLLEELGDIDEEDAINIGYMVVDWQDPDFSPCNGQGSDEREFWTEWGLEKFGNDLPLDWSFEPKNDLIMTLDELLSIPGITRDLLYGDPDSGLPKVSDRRRSRRARINEEEPRALADYVSVQSSGQVNINTAPELLLEAIVSVAVGSDSGGEGIAKKIIEYRDQQDPSRVSKTVIMNAQTQLIEAGIPQEMIQRINQVFPLTNISSYFTIKSRGTYRGVSRTMEFRVNVRAEPYQVDPKKDPGRRDRRARALLKNKEGFTVDPAVRVQQIITQ